jgi:hypothetical protein
MVKWFNYWFWWWSNLLGRCMFVSVLAFFYWWEWITIKNWFSDRIERASSLDGTNREVIWTVVHPFAITVHGH